MTSMKTTLVVAFPMSPVGGGNVDVGPGINRVLARLRRGNTSDSALRLVGYVHGIL